MRTCGQVVPKRRLFVVDQLLMLFLNPFFEQRSTFCLEGLVSNTKRILRYRIDQVIKTSHTIVENPNPSIPATIFVESL